MRYTTGEIWKRYTSGEGLHQPPVEVLIGNAFRTTPDGDLRYFNHLTGEPLDGKPAIHNTKLLHCPDQWMIECVGSNPELAFQLSFVSYVQDLKYLYEVYEIQNGKTHEVGWAEGARLFAEKVQTGPFKYRRDLQTLAVKALGSNYPTVLANLTSGGVLSYLEDENRCDLITDPHEVALARLSGKPQYIFL